MSDKKEIKTVQQVSELVNGIADECHMVMTKRTEQLNDNQRWLVIARVTNILFASFYNMAIKSSNELFERTEKKIQEGERNNVRNQNRTNGSEARDYTKETQEDKK